MNHVQNVRKNNNNTNNKVTREFTDLDENRIVKAVTNAMDILYLDIRISIYLFVCLAATNLFAKKKFNE